MNIDDYLRLGQIAIETALYTCAPILLFGLVAGLLVSIFQAATQINDPALAFIPKIAAAIIGMILFGHFMINRIAGFTVYAISQIANLTPR
ncbi:MAG: flagellar biosynthesis protein FliQ [Proteobacteria bacterium]|jgi:flagellar biosynthesis protein FliQ|nr:flagellar biosynthesis protein FliQ [Pseudomonadota bacterium]